MESKRNKALKWIIPAASAAAVTLTAGSLVRMGLHFMGPLRHLAVDKIKLRYPSDEHQKGILFYGASNFARWKDLESDLTGLPVQNHGFGGSTDKDLIRYAEEILFPYDPRIVVFQTGSNDYVQEKGTDEEKIQICMERKINMFHEFHERLPEAHFVVMSGLLLPGRSQFLDLTLEINRRLSELCAATPWMTYIDAGDMTYSYGEYAEDLFVKDRIHLNRDGQRRWADHYIRPALTALWQDQPSA